MSDRVNDAIEITTDIFSEDDLIRRVDAVEALAEWGISPLVLMPVPSAQRTGEWLRYGEDGNPNEEDTVFWQCDQCLETYTDRTTRIPNFCPNCGADMRGDDNHDI